MHSLKGLGRIASVGLAAVMASLYACSDTAGPEQASNAIAPNGAPSLAAAAGGPGRVAAFGFNEASGSTTPDASGSGNTGYLGAGITRTTSGKFGGALVFNGTGWVAIANSPSLQLSSAMTLEAWVKPSTIDNTWRDIIIKGSEDYSLMATSTNGSRPQGGGRIASTSSATKTFGPSPLATDVWTHVAGTYDGSMIRLYVNGTQVSSTAKTGAITTSWNALMIGGDNIWGQFFKGAIDEVRVYNRALGASEIQSDMNTAIGTATTPTPDTQAPTVSITAPATTGTYSTTATTATVSGTASDNVGVTQVAWTNSLGGSGTASGTSTWSAASVALQVGANVVTVTARDAANNQKTATITITRTTVTPPPTTSGLVAAYGFDEASGSATTDASGNSNAGSFGGGVSRTTTGKFGGALVFNGGSVTIPNSSSISLTSAMTLSAWVNPSATSNEWKDLIQKGNDNYYLMAMSDHNSLPAGGGRFAGQSGSTNTFGSSPLPVNAWTHLALTYDGSMLRLYVNGTQVSTAARTGPINTTTNALTLGGDPFYGQYFQGTIDEVRIYNRALSATEVQADLNAPVNKTTTPPPPSTPTPTTVTIAPATATVAIGASQTLAATVKDQNGAVMTGQAVTWSSSNTAVATVNASGVVTGVAAGSATITATSSGKTGTASITVPAATTPTPTTVTVAPATATVAIGASQTLAATVKDQNGAVMTGQGVTWSSSNTAVATVNGSGVVTGVKAGSATITATSSGKTGTASITVPAATPTPTTVAVAPASVTLAAGASQSLTATVRDQNGAVMSGQTVTWSSSNSSVASVSASGVVSGVNAGSATITATSSGKTGTATVSVTAAPPPPTGGSLLFEEKFEDGNVASRGWYASTNVSISTTEHTAGSNASIQYHFLQGATSQAGTSAMRHKFTPSNSLYISYDVKYSSNWVGSGRSYHPHEINVLSTLDSDWAGPSDNFLGLYLEHNYQNGGIPRMGIQDNQSINTSYGSLPRNLIGVTENRSVGGCNGVAEPNVSSECFATSSTTGYYNLKLVSGPVVLQPNAGSAGYKGNWNHIEAYFQLNTIVNGIGQANGVMQYWFNGQLIIDRHDILFRTGARPTVQFNQFLLTPYIGDGSPVDQSMWIDNLRVGTARLP